jgi:hypothetical protein
MIDLHQVRIFSIAMSLQLMFSEVAFFSILLIFFELVTFCMKEIPWKAILSLTGAWVNLPGT